MINKISDIYVIDFIHIYIHICTALSARCGVQPLNCTPAEYHYPSDE